MSSDLEQAAASVRAFGKHAIRVMHDLTSIQKDLQQLIRRAAEVRGDGLPLIPLRNQLLDAEQKLVKAIERVQNFSSQSATFAERLVRGASTVSASSSSTTASTQPANELANDPSNTALVGKLGELGLSLSRVDQFDLGSNPILDWKKGAPADIQWAVTAWNDQIAPGLATGATRADFEKYDTDSNAPVDRRLAIVWDTFLGDDPIKADSPQPNGFIGLTGGRHRIQSALFMGVKYLPVKW